MIVSRPTGLGRASYHRRVPGLRGVYSPGQCDWSGTAWVGSAVQPTGVCATNDNNYGPPCPGGQVSLKAHDVPLPYFGVGNLMGLLQETINRNGSCPRDLLGNRPAAESDWLCMALSKLYGQWKATGCVDIHGGSASFTIGGQVWHGDLLGPIAEVAATGHCSQDIFLNACPSSPTATRTALDQIKATYGNLVPGVQPGPGVTAQNFAASPLVNGTVSQSAAGVTVSLSNTTNLSSTNFQVGDSFVLKVTGAKPNQPVGISVTHDGAPSTANLGNTDMNGNFSLTGTMSNAELGNWVENYSVGGTVIAQFSFSVTSKQQGPSTSPLTPATTDTTIPAPASASTFLASAGNFLGQDVAIGSHQIPVWLIAAAAGGGLLLWSSGRGRR